MNFLLWPTTVTAKKKTHGNYLDLTAKEIRELKFPLGTDEIWP